MKKLFTLFIILVYISNAFCQELTWEQQQRLQTYFDTNSKFVGISKPILEKVMSEHKDFFGNYSDALAAVDILNKVANAQDAQALESSILFVEGKIVEKILPGLGSVLSWASWAKTGMEVLKQFVVDPALLTYAIDTYSNNRDKFGFDPDAAQGNIQAWGNIEQQLLGIFRSDYGDLPFKEIKPSGMVLLDTWKPKFDKFVTAWFEIQYQNKKLKEIQEKARKEIEAQKVQIEKQSVEIEQWIKQKLKEPKELTISPAYQILKINESVEFVVSVTLFNGETENVTEKTLPNATFTASKPGETIVSAEYLGLVAQSKIVVKEPDNNCGPNETWDDVRNECICETGYERNDQGICVEISSDDSEEINCPDPNSEKVWDDAQQKYVCNCKENFIIDPTTGMCVEDINSLIAQSDCANVPGAVAEWDPVNKIVTCRCTQDFYTWDDAQKKCVPDIQAIIDNSDCSQYLNTQPVWDYSSNEPICDCKPGYVWNEEGTGCVDGEALQVANSDCSGYFNSRPVWDEDSEMVICDCLPGYVWNKEGTGCVPEWEEAIANADCSGYGNTEPVWDPVGKEIYCDCIAGYQWADDNLHCERITTEQTLTEGCSQYPNTEPVYDPSTDQYFCECLPGYIWNSSRTGCVPERKKPDIDWGGILTATMDILNAANGNSNFTGTSFTGSAVGTQTQQPVVHQSNCNDQQEAGGDAPEVHNINLGQAFGTFIFDYETFSVKDQIIVTQGGQTIFNTGCVGADGSVPLNLNGRSSTISVRVNPNCDGTSGTSWNFTVHCPNN